MQPCSAGLKTFLLIQPHPDPFAGLFCSRSLMVWHWAALPAAVSRGEGGDFASQPLRTKTQVHDCSFLLTTCGCTDTHIESSPLFFLSPPFEAALDEYFQLRSWPIQVTEMRNVYLVGSVSKRRGHAPPKRTATPAPVKCFHTRMWGLMLSDLLLFLEKPEIQILM